MKKIFLLSATLYGYEKVIIENFFKIDYGVDFLDYSKKNYKKAREISNFFVRLYNDIYLRKYKKINLKDQLEAKELNKDLLKIDGNKYEYFIKIGPIFLEESSLKILREKFKICISHHWDTIEKNNEKKFLLEKKYFKKISSYNKKDSIKYNINYLPNFYYKTVENNTYIKNSIFTIMSDFSRLGFLEKIAKTLKDNEIDYDINLITSKKINSSLIKVSSKSMDLENVLNEILKYKAVLELVRERNKGCSTFRAIECIGLRKKLITNNKDIIYEDYYNRNNILIIDEKNINIPKKFLESSYEEIPREIFEKYKIENWIKSLIKI